MSEVAVFLGAVALIAVVGVVLGILVAPRLERLTEPHDDEEPGGRDLPADDDDRHA